MASSSPPSSILIIGSGVFGLSTAYELTKRESFANTTITILDRSPVENVFPSPDASSIDTSRIIRPDYCDRAYANLAAEAHDHWRRTGDDELGGQGRYSESGLLLMADNTPAPASTIAPPSGKKTTTGLDYVQSSWNNICELAEEQAGMSRDKMHLLPSREAIAESIGMTPQTSPGEWGYLNGNSGWAHPERSMAWFLAQVRKTNRVNFVHGTAEALLHAGDRVTGAKLIDGRELTADMVMVATGAWTGALVDLAGQAVATGQVIGYMDITPEEEAAMKDIPVILNFSSGLFIMPPCDGQLKAARHGYGYVNPRPTPEGCLPTRPGGKLSSPMVSLPRTHITNPEMWVPAEGEADLRRAIRTCTPLKQLYDRPFTSTRLCWYTDTADADFLIDYHPGWKGLFLATAGAGHGFKYLPIIGGRIADCIEGKRPKEFDAKWRWKDIKRPDSDVEDLFCNIVTEDGSRGGKPGLVLEKELAKGSKL